MPQPIFRNKHFLPFQAAAILCGFLALPASAQLIALEPDQAGPDFAVQGEYSGMTEPQGSQAPAKLGAQVVANGDGNFRVVFFPGGLPGDGWTGTDRFESVGQTGAGGTGISGGDYQGSITGDSLKGGNIGGERFVLIRKNRISPTVGLAPPAKATVLFDGSSLDEWDNADKDSRNFFAPLSPIAMTRKKFANFSLHLEFREPFMPFAQGQPRGNSGLKFLIAKAFFAEIQILDSFGNEAREDECGGIEVFFAPDVVASFPPLTWQTYDIHLTTPVSADSNAVGKGNMTVWHNGILIHSGRELPAMATAVNIALQENGGSVCFRNMWILDGDDKYPFFPGAAVRPGRSAGPASGKGPLIRGVGKGRAREILLRGPEGTYLSNGTRVPIRSITPR